MNPILGAHKTLLHFIAPLAATAALLFASTVQAQNITLETLVDREQILDLLHRYYDDLSAGRRHALSDYFVEDAVLDVDSTVAVGHDEINALYRPEGEEEAAPAEPRELSDPVRRMHMVLSNPIIEVTGDSATIHVIWTGIINEGIGKVPYLYEQGREYSELVKRDGKWLIKHRYISSDSGLPDRFDATYTPREHR